MINIDVEKGTISDESNISINLYSKEGYKLISDIWLKVGYDQKNLYSNNVDNVVGFNIDIEEPLNPDVTILNDGSKSLEEIASQLKTLIKR